MCSEVLKVTTVTAWPDLAEATGTLAKWSNT